MHNLKESKGATKQCKASSQKEVSTIHTEFKPQKNQTQIDWRRHSYLLIIKDNRWKQFNSWQASSMSSGAGH
jgi:hypothetical protein